MDTGTLNGNTKHDIGLHSSKLYTHMSEMKPAYIYCLLISIASLVRIDPQYNKMALFFCLFVFSRDSMAKDGCLIGHPVCLSHKFGSSVDLYNQV